MIAAAAEKLVVEEIVHVPDEEGENGTIVLLCCHSNECRLYRRLHRVAPPPQEALPLWLNRLSLFPSPSPSPSLGLWTISGSDGPALEL